MASFVDDSSDVLSHRPFTRTHDIGRPGSWASTSSGSPAKMAGATGGRSFQITFAETKVEEVRNEFQSTEQHEEQQEVDEICAGDIAACVGLKDVTTGETLCDPDNIIMLERMVFPEPVIAQAVEPKTKADQEKMGIALQRLAAEDPSFRVKTDEESGQTIISGMGELHLEIIIDRLKREYGVDANIGAPQVAYRETISKAHTETYTHKKQSGGSGQYARVKIRFAPTEPGTGFAFENSVVGGNVPKEYIPGVEKGLNSVLSSGPLIGFPVVDLKVALIDGVYHEVDSSAIAFEIATRAAMREAFENAGAVLLEPMMKVEVTSPEEFVGSVIGDLNSRRGHIQAMVLRVGGAGKKQPFAPFGQCKTTHDQDHGQHLNHLLIGLHISALFQRVKKRKAQLIKRP